MRNWRRNINVWHLLNNSLVYRQIETSFSVELMLPSLVLSTRHKTGFPTANQRAPKFEPHEMSPATIVPFLKSNNIDGLYDTVLLNDVIYW